MRSSRIQAAVVRGKVSTSSNKKEKTCCFDSESETTAVSECVLRLQLGCSRQTRNFTHISCCLRAENDDKKQIHEATQVPFRLVKPDDMNLWLTVLYVLSSSAGLVFNGFILLVLLWQKRIHTANHLLLLHLAVVDTLFCFLILLVNTSIASIDPESLDDELQQPLRLQGVAWTVLPAVLIWTICGMSIDRYATVCYPFTHKTLVSSDM